MESSQRFNLSYCFWCATTFISFDNLSQLGRFTYYNIWMGTKCISAFQQQEYAYWSICGKDNLLCSWYGWHLCITTDNLMSVGICWMSIAWTWIFFRKHCDQMRWPNYNKNLVDWRWHQLHKALLKPLTTCLRFHLLWLCTRKILLPFDCVWSIVDALILFF